MRNRATGDFKHYFKNYVAKGTSLPAGEYAYAEGSTDYSITLNAEVSYLGEIDLRNPAADTNQLLECLATYDKAGMYIPAGDCILPIEKQDGGVSHLYFITPHAIGTRLDKYNNPVCDLIDAGQDKSLGYGVSGHVYPLIGTVKYRFMHTPGFQFEADNEKSIAKVGVCLPDIFLLNDEFEIKLGTIAHTLKISSQLYVALQLIRQKMITQANNQSGLLYLKTQFDLSTSFLDYSSEALHELTAALNMNQLTLTAKDGDLNALRTVFDKLLPKLTISADESTMAKHIIDLIVTEKLKEYEIKKLIYTDIVNEEYSLSLACQHLRARSPLFGVSLDKKPISCQLMRKMPGMDLFEHFNNQCLDVTHPKYKRLTFDDCMQICLGSFRSLKHQMHDNGLVHRDLKPDNIMAHQVNGLWLTNIIDTGLSRFAHRQDNNPCGNEDYSPPEQFQGQSGFSSDVYSIGKVASVVIANVLKAAPLSIQIRLKDLFLSCMQDKMEDRPSLQKCIEDLMAIYFDYKKLSLVIPKDQHEVADIGFNLGKDAVNVITAASRTRVIELAANHFTKQLNEFIVKLPDNPNAITSFLDVINVKCLHGIRSKAALTAKVTEISTLFYQHLDAIKSVRHELQSIRDKASQLEGCTLNTDFGKKIALDGHIKQLDEFLLKNSDCRLDLDVLAAQCTHFNNKLIKSRCAKKYFEGLLPTQLDLAPVSSYRK